MPIGCDPQIVTVNPQPVDGAMGFSTGKGFGAKSRVGQALALQYVRKVDRSQLLPTTQLLEGRHLRVECLAAALPCSMGGVRACDIAIRHFAHIKFHERQFSGGGLRFSRCPACGG